MKSFLSLSIILIFGLPQFLAGQILTPEVKVEVTNGNYTGIGTNAPTATLSLKGINNNRVLDAYQASPNVPMFIFNTSSGNPNLIFYDNTGINQIVKLNTSGHSYFNGGNIGIGTINPSADIHVLRTNNTGANIRLEGYDGHFAVLEANSSGGVVSISDNNGTAKTIIRGYGDSHFEAGKVSMGTNNPTATLTLKGISNNRVLDGYQGGTSRLMFMINTSSGWPHFSLYDNMGTSTLVKLSANGDSFFNGGNLGVGTSTPNYKLDVNGSLNASSLYNSGQLQWSDFVFNKDYKLPELKEVEQYIEKNGHLPQIPSESEVVEQGYNLGDMDAKLLQKIEELTLYLIKQNKKIEQLEKELNALKNK